MRTPLVAAVALATALAAHATPPPFPGLTTAVITSPDVDLPIPDAGSLVSLLDVDLPGVVVDVDATLDLTHPQPDQLDIFLVSPLGTTITLTTDNGGGNDDVFAGTVFDDQAEGTPSAPNVRNFPYANLVPTGRVQPEEAMAAVVGEVAAGPWALVVVDDTGGTTGRLQGWSLTVSTLGALHPDDPLAVAGTGGPIPNDPAASRESVVTVAGAGARLLDLDVTLDITHPNAADLDLFLTAPSGRRIDLVTDVGGGNDGLFVGTVFDDQAGLAVSDTPQPADGVAFLRVVPEGALGAWLGEDPNGAWTLTVVDDTSGNTGTLNGWSLTLVTATACGDGGVDADEACDDGNAVDGDGCDSNCTVTACGNGIVSAGEDCDDGNTQGGDTCPAGCRTVETVCDDCRDDDGNGLVDSLDPACQPAELRLGHGAVRFPGDVARGKLKLAGGLALPAGTGTAGLVLADATGTLLCAPLGEPAGRGRARTAKAALGNGRVTLKLLPKAGGSFTVAGRGLDLSALEDRALRLGVRLGTAHFAGGATFRAVGSSRWVHP